MEQKLNQNTVRGTVYVLLSAVFFSLGGVLIKLIPWSSMSIQGIRSLFSFFVIAAAMVLTKHKFRFNRSILLGAGCNFIMSLSFVMATKLTSAANAIVLQFTEPVFVILFLWIIYKKKPQKQAVITCILVFCGILCFFFESLSPGNMIGNLLAVLSGLSYAGVFLMKGFQGGDFESSMLLSHIFSMIVGLPACFQETEASLSIWVYIILLGILQYGVSYLFLSKGLDYVSPVTASLTSTIEPILNPILVAIFCHETIGFISMIGAVLVLSSCTIYNVLQAKQPAPDSRKK